MYKCMTKDIPLSSFASHIFQLTSVVVVVVCDNGDYESDVNHTRRVLLRRST